MRQPEKHILMAKQKKKKKKSNGQEQEDILMAKKKKAFNDQEVYILMASSCSNDTKPQLEKCFWIDNVCYWPRLMANNRKD